MSEKRAGEDGRKHTSVDNAHCDVEFSHVQFPSVVNIGQCPGKHGGEKARVARQHVE